MLTPVQKEILRSLINLYRQAKCTSVKCENIADLMGRNAGTIRNQMQSLRSLGLVQGVPGPRGGYKPTLEAYQTLNIENDPCEIHVPIHVNDELISDVSVNKIEFTSILRPGNCEATVSVLGNIKQLDLDDEIKIGPTPVNNLTVVGTIIGRDDVDNALLIKTDGIFSIPNIPIKELATPLNDTIGSDMSLSEVATIMIKEDVIALPVVDDSSIIGIVYYSDVIRMVSQEKFKVKVQDFLNENFVVAKENNSLIHSMDTLQNQNSLVLILEDDNDELTGIVSVKDIINRLVDYPN